MSVVATGVQSCRDRFGDKSRLDRRLPPLSKWRCNLTGLSQARNLYFVACGEHIHVHVPQFPTQAIADRPALVFTSSPSAPSLTGYMNERTPHAVNNLLVHLLGTEEVVAVVRDDGDVDAFLVRHVAHAIERRARSGSTIGVFADEVRPFFQSNVGMSAWGLAIHAQARILATSSNAHEVRVFKFGLLGARDESSNEDDDDDSDDHGDDDGEILPDADDDAPGCGRRREIDVTHHVLNGESNIPAIAFCNTGDDPEARWLLTTDIGGICRVMDLRLLRPVQAFRFGPPSVRTPADMYDRLYAGWSIMFLDRRSFRPERTPAVALGLGESGSLADVKRSSQVWDIGKTVEILSRASVSRHLVSPQPPSFDMRGVGQEGRSDVESLGSGDALAPADHSENMSDWTNEETDVTDDSMDDVPRTDDDVGSVLDAATMATVTEDLDSEDEGTEDHVSDYDPFHEKPTCSSRPMFAVPAERLCDDLPCPILHTSARTVYLLQSSNQKHQLGPFAPPMIGISNPLCQFLQDEFERLNFFDRLCMTAYIDPIGVVILASQKGRALVISLTKFSKVHVHSSATKSLQAGKTYYCMRVECILPFPVQEEANQRPLAPLHGIAVGPMQGSEGVKEDKKRWRLMMMYQDHSILSYEISGKPSESNSMLNVESLVV